MTGPRLAAKARRTVRALLRLAPLTITGFMQFSWFGSLAVSPDPYAIVRRDWHQFFQTGHQLVAGDLSAIYPRTFESGYFWLYPPYCIYLTAPLGMLPEWWAYALCVVVEVLAVAGALALLRAALPARGEDHTTAAIVILASMPFNTSVVIGQISGMLSLILAASLWAWRRRRTLVAGLLLSLLFIKPNLAIFFVAASLLARQWRVLAGMGLGGATMVLASLPLGLERWREYVHTSRDYVSVVQNKTLMWKQLTLYAFWRTATGGTSSDLAVVAPWLASVAVVLGVTMLAWWRRRDSEAALPRLFGLTVLLAVSANMYVYFYDGLVLLVPGVVWWVLRDEYRSRWRHALIGACLLGIFVVGYLRIFLTSEGINWAGALIAIWLVCEAVDLLARTDETTYRVDSAPDQHGITVAPVTEP